MTVELFQDDPYLRSCNGVVETVDSKLRCFSTDCTVFYPTGGGQPGDTGGAFYSNDQEIGIIDTRRDRNTGQIQHFIEDQAELPVIGDELYMELDWGRRYRLMRMHSCLHLLCAIIPGRVTGCQIHDGRGRVDFDLSEPNDKDQLTHSLNLLIRQNAQRVNLVYTSEELNANRELKENLSVPPPDISGSVNLVHFDGIDIQPCGGTHVASTEEIGCVRVQKIENKGRQNRRFTIVLDD